MDVAVALVIGLAWVMSLVAARWASTRPLVAIRQGMADLRVEAAGLRADLAAVLSRGADLERRLVDTQRSLDDAVLRVANESAERAGHAARADAIEAARAAAEQRCTSLAAERNDLREELGRLRIEATSLRVTREEQHIAHRKQLEAFEQAGAAAKELLASVAGDALRKNTEQLLQLVQPKLDAANAQTATVLDKGSAGLELVVRPLEATLKALQERLQEVEFARERTGEALNAQVDRVVRVGDSMNAQATSLASALRRPGPQGRWGELQLRRLLELADMVEQCDFDTQAVVDSGDGLLIPDVVVSLPGSRRIVIDSKVSLEAFLRSLEALDETSRLAGLEDHVRSIRHHIDKLAQKDYGGHIQPSPDCVLMFVPGEGILATALSHDTDLLQYGAARRVVLVSPSSLLATLYAVAYSWRQDEIATTARDIVELGRKLHDRIGTVMARLTKVGRALNSGVSAYNDAITSAESRLMPTMRQLREKGIYSAKKVVEPAKVDIVASLPQPLPGDVEGQGHLGEVDDAELVGALVGEPID
jgi:DNA recombination protein RmuC